MSDLIERQAAIDAINTHFGFNIEEEYGSAVQEVINGLPSAQPEPITVNIAHELTQEEYEKLRKDMANAPIMLFPSVPSEIIRCKDCKYAEPNGKYGCEVYHYKLYETHDMKADDFCSRAERRTDG